jgi:hypothetical protein
VTAVSARAATAALLAFVCFVTVRGTSMSAVAGDEPHYLVRVLVWGSRTAKKWNGFRGAEACYCRRAWSGTSRK